MGCNLFSQLLREIIMILVVRDLPSVQMQEQKWIFAVRMLYLADVPDYVLYSTANEQG